MTETATTRDRVKAVLRGYRPLCDELDQLREELKQFELTAYAPGTSASDGTPRAPGVSNPVQAAALRHAELRDHYAAKVAQIDAERLKIEKMIDVLDPTERRLIRCKYFEGYTWEDVCVRIAYGWSQTHRIHARALQKLAAAEDRAAVGG